MTDRRQLPRYAAGSIDVPFVIAGAAESVTEDTHWEAHSHPTHELLWNDRGASSASVGNRTWTITPSVGLWIPAGTTHWGWMPSGTRYRAAHFSIRRTNALADRPVAVDMSPLLRLLFDRLSVTDLAARSREVTEDMVLDLLAPSEHELLLRIPTSAVLAPVVATLESDPADATSLAQWAARLQISSRTLTRLFRSETGLDFTRWVATFRTQQAIAMLGRGMPIDDVASRVGFRSVSAFGAAFRRVTGMSPGRFRSQ